MTDLQRIPTDIVPTEDEPPWRIVARTAAFLVGLPALLFSFYLLLIAWGSSQNLSREPREAENFVQAIIGGTAAVALAITASLSLLYFRDGRDGRRFALAIGITLGLVLTWRLGFSTWCSDCGVPRER